MNLKSKLLLIIVTEESSGFGFSFENTDIFIFFRTLTAL